MERREEESEIRDSASQRYVLNSVTRSGHSGGPAKLGRNFPHHVGGDGGGGGGNEIAKMDRENRPGTLVDKTTS